MGVCACFFERQVENATLLVEQVYYSLTRSECMSPALVFLLCLTFLTWPSQRGFARDAGRFADDSLAHMLHGSGDCLKASLRERRQAPSFSQRGSLSPALAFISVTFLTRR